MGLRSIGVCFLLYICFIEVKGSSAQTRFIKTEENLLMTLTEEVKFEEGDIFDWNINQSKIIIRLNGDKTLPQPEYKNRIDFFKQNVSLILKKVKRKDTGIYTAVLSGLAGVKTLATYNITVQAPVSPVTVKVDSVSNSSDLCNFTVSCRTDQSNISHSFTCDRITCGPDLHYSVSSLTVSLSDVSIICNHSNHVSWRNDTKDLREVCPLFGSGNPSNKPKNNGVIIGVCVTAAVLCPLIATVVLLRKKSKNERVNTVYDTPQEASPRPPADTIYSEVQPHSAPPPAPAPGPESLYATVNKPQNPLKPMSVV